MRIQFRIAALLLDEIRADLARPHPFAFERVGFIIARCTHSTSGIIILAARYVVVPDEGYEHDESVGAMMNQVTIFSAMQLAFTEKVSIFHVHEHPGIGTPRFSNTDQRENAKFTQSFINVRPEYPHGALVLSANSLAGVCWVPGARTSSRIDQFTAVGSHVQKIA